ncbi:unnamed protein product [Paramecium sonneborni]|uniref:Uncharacterized protein n=1 Tax=Paramecium sonneborni TaxID=65129 RepID=A0A8S1QI23_9CILI|nr:unnamed protein product [Paramecium sonneborni]
MKNQNYIEKYKFCNKFNWYKLFFSQIPIGQIQSQTQNIENQKIRKNIVKRIQNTKGVKRRQYKTLNRCLKIKQLFMEIKSSVSQGLSCIYMILLDGGTRVNQYFQSNNHRGGSALKGGRLQTNIQTPKMKMHNSFNDQLVIHNLQNHPLQLRQSPSFKYKTHRLSLKQDDTQQQNKISETYARKTRITVLESFYNQLGTDEDISLVKNSPQKKQKPIILTPKSQTTYFGGQQNQMNEIDNIEEAHFQFVCMQQKYKSWLENFEKKNHSK